MVQHLKMLLFSVLQLISPSESIDGSKGSSMRRKHQDSFGSQDSAAALPSTPDRYCTVLDWPTDEWSGEEMCRNLFEKRADLDV